jgi:hypothetical protein
MTRVAPIPMAIAPRMEFASMPIIYLDLDIAA